MSLLSLTTRSCLSSTTRFVFECACVCVVDAVHACVHSPVTLCVPCCVSVPTFPAALHPEWQTFSGKIHRAVCLPSAQIHFAALLSLLFAAFSIFFCFCCVCVCKSVCLSFSEKLNRIFSFFQLEVIQGQLDSLT